MPRRSSFTAASVTSRADASDSCVARSWSRRPCSHASLPDSSGPSRSSWAAALERVGDRLVAAVLEDEQGEGLLTLRFRAVVNATGPWLDGVRRLADPGSRPIARLSKGVHAVLSAPDDWQAGLAVSLSGNRASFALP